LGLRLVRGSPRVSKSDWVIFEGKAAPDGLGSFRRIGKIAHIHDQAEAVEKLRPKLPLLRIHGADQNEISRMTQRQAFAFQSMNPRGGRIEQNVHEVIGEQIDFVDVKDAAIGRRQ
jgi:hypothetical protein